MRVLITGVTGQDGSYLAEQLTQEGHEIFGMVRGSYHPKQEWLMNLVPGIQLVPGDLLDQPSLYVVLKSCQPDVIYNLGALTYVGMSWQQPAVMTEVTGLGVLRLLETIRSVNSEIRLVHASSSEQFGSSPAPQDERTQFHPRSPYGVAKTMAHHTVVNYRESYGMHLSTAIMFNHTSPRRGLEFVERKVTTAAAMIKAGKLSQLKLGNLTARRDWGWAPDYMRALPLIAAQELPTDYVIATGVSRSVLEMVDFVFAFNGLNWEEYVFYDPALDRPADVEHLAGNASKAQLVLGWYPTMSFGNIMTELAAYDWERIK